MLAKSFGRLKKSMVLFLACLMLVSMLPMTALAAVSAQGAKQYYDEYGVEVTDATEIASGNYAVALEKSIKATENENEYEITLTVDTTARIVETEKIVGADIVLVFDVSSSMDYTVSGTAPGKSNGWKLDDTRWTALKTAATSFIEKMLPEGTSNRISIVVYGGSNNNSREYNHATLCDWTSNAAKAKASYSSYDVVSQSYISYATYTTSLRRAVFEDTGTSYGATNCQAGFYAAEQMLDTAREGTLPYVVYMSDGDANRYIGECTQSTGWGSSHTHSFDCQVSLNGGTCTSTNNSTYAVRAAQAQATQLKTKCPKATLYTVGFGTSATNAVMNKTYNTAVDESYITSNAADLLTVYDYVAEQIELTANPWTVIDPMGTQVLLDVSIEENPYVTLSGDGFKWSLLQEQEADQNKRSFTLTYTITLDVNSNPGYWADGVANPTNGDTFLIYQIVKKDNQGNTIATNDAVRAYFDVPTVTAKLYTVTLNHWQDAPEMTGTPTNTQTFTYGVGYEIDLDANIKTYPYFTYTGRDQYNSDGTVITTSGDTDGTVINYHYKSGYPLTINYTDIEDGVVLSEQYREVFGSGERYAVDSPEIPGYELVNATQSTIEGTMPDNAREIDVLYKKSTYKVVYEITSNDNPSYTLPVDDQLHYYNNEVTVAEALTADGWTFSGWTVKDGDGTVYSNEPYTITGNVVFQGSWERNTYNLDVIYVFDDDTTVDDSLTGLGDFYDDTDPYTAADGMEYENVYVKVDLQSVTFGDPYSYYADTANTTGYKVSPASIAGTVAGNTTVIFTLTNNKFTLTVNYWLQDFDDLSNYCKNNNATVNSALLGGADYNAEVKDFSGYEYHHGDNALTGEMPDNDLEINIYYNATPYTASFTYVGTAPLDEPDDQAPIYYGSFVTDPGVSCTGWTFSGWYTDGEMVNSYNFKTPVTADVVLYGSWTRNTYHVTYQFANPSSAPSGVMAPANSIDYNYGETFAEQGAPDFTNPTGATYTFDGWYRTLDCTGEKYDFNTPVTGSLTLWGKWTRETNQYEYSVEHYLVSGGVSERKATVSGGAIDYGYTFSQSEVNSMALTGDALEKAMGHSHVTFTGAAPITITESEGDNIVKCYYTVNSYNLTIYYEYQNGMPAADTHGPVKVEYGGTYNVTSPSVPNYHVQDTGKLTVYGTMPAQDVVEHVIYAQDPMYQVTVKYRAVGDDDTPIAGDYATAAMYAGTEYTIESEYLGAKSIPYYTYSHMVNGDYAEGPMGEAERVITVYFTHNTNTLKVSHVDQTGERDFSEYDTSVTMNQGDPINVTPITPIPDGYKLISASAEGTAAQDGDNFSGTLIDNVEITYTYAPLANNYVIINYLIDGTDDQVPGNSPYILGPVKENAPYDVTDAYNLEITGYDRVTETVALQAGTMGVEDVRLNVYYTALSYPYEVVYINDYTGAEIARYDDEEILCADFGTQLNEEIVGAAMALKLEFGDGESWIDYHRPSGYYLNGVIYCTINVEENVIEVHYSYSSGGGGGSGGGSGTSGTTINTTVILDEETPLSALETDDHLKYLNGYTDGSVRAEGAITRSEAASIFYRLLKETYKDGHAATPFSDVPSDAWYSLAVSTLADLGIITGYPDGTFRPDSTITRAEFATMASRFDNLEDTSGNIFSDVPSTHWAAKYINSAYAKGWVNGYPDGTFNPDGTISRAEVVTIVNSMLNRAIDDTALAGLGNPYNDINSSHWAYAGILEASVYHDYNRDDAGTEFWMTAYDTSGNIIWTAA